MASDAVGSGVRSGHVRPDAPFESHLGRVLTLLGRERATGVLEIDASRRRTAFYLHQGTVVFADAGTVSETLGRLLVRQGALRAEDYATILRRMTEALVDDEVMRFGEVAIELGFVSPADVSSALARQVHEKLVRCLELDEAHWLFREDREAVARVARYPCSLTAATLEAVLSPDDAASWELRLAQFGSRAPVLRQEPSTLDIPPDVLRIAHFLDGSRSVADLHARKDRGGARSLGVIAALLILDLCDLRDLRDPPVARPRASLRPGKSRGSGRPSSPAATGRNRKQPSGAPSAEPERGRTSAPAPASTRPSKRAGSRRPVGASSGESLGAPVPTSRAAHQAAPVAAASPSTAASPREARPTRSAQEAAQRALELRAELERGHAAALRAGVAQPVDAARPSAAHKTRLSAEQCYAHGRRALADGQLAVAVRELETAAQEMPEAVEYRLAAAFARWLAATSDDARATEVRRVKTLLVETMKDDRRCALAYYVHGRVSLAQDDTDAAARAFRNATRLDPQDREMARWARHVGPPKKSTKKA